jgi:hypothetical protein
MAVAINAALWQQAAINAASSVTPSTSTCIRNEVVYRPLQLHRMHLYQVIHL